MQENTDYLEKLKGVIKDKADKQFVEKIASDIKNYAKYSEMKELYKKVIPPLKKYEDTMFKVVGEHQRMQEIIRRYDELLTVKVNKSTLVEMEEKAE